MKNIYLNAGTINEVFNGLKTSLKGVLNSNNNDFKLALDTDLIKGKIHGIKFINGTTSIQISITCSDDITLSMESLSTSSIVFAYCNGGYFKHSFGISGPQSTLKKHHSAVVTSSRSINTILHFSKNIPVQFSIIKVETAGLEKAISDSLIINLKKTFLDKQPHCTHQGVQNIRIAKKIHQLKTITEQGMVGHILKKDIIRSILLTEIDDNTDFIIKLSHAIKHLALYQIDELKKMYCFIKHYTFDAIYNKVSTSKNSVFIK